MIFTIKVERNKTTGDWTQKIFAAGLEISARALRRLSDELESRGGFPQPPDGEIDAQSSSLSTTGDVEKIWEIYDRIARNSPRPDDVKIFGDYLFAALIGEAAWQTILAQTPGNEKIDLRFQWNDDEWDFYRLPWEMMRRADGFLANDARVTMTRVVPDAGNIALPPSFVPKILFVIGADLRSDEIRAGAEYMDLLRRVKKLKISISSRVLVSATMEQIEDEIKAFQPTVVHFICHGGYESGAAGQAYLEVTPGKNDSNTRLYAAALLSKLKEGGKLPVAVILNACYLAAPPPSRIAPPFAVELVKGGIPVVVAMGGRVADAACRLFTRRFYESLHTDEPIHQAAANGRRAGFANLGVPPESVTDWALPTLFLAENSPVQIRADAQWLELAKKRETLASRYRIIKNPECFCGRFEFLQEYQKMVNSPVGELPAQIVLAVEADWWKSQLSKKEVQKYGKTRLLEELAAQAVSDGHLPCLVTFTCGESMPTNAIEIGNNILEALEQTCDRFGIDYSSVLVEFDKLRRQSENDASISLHPAVAHKQSRAAATEKFGGKVVRAALQIDLLALQAKARAELNNPALKILVLIDDVHRFGDGARQLLEMFNEAGMGDYDNPVPVVFTFSSDGFADDERHAVTHAVTTLTGFLRERPSFFTHLPLRDFRPPKDDWLLYQRFLFYRTPGRIIRCDKLEVMAAVYESVYEDSFYGVPSQIESDSVRAGIKAYDRAGILTEPKDDDWLGEETDD